MDYAHRSAKRRKDPSGHRTGVMTLYVCIAGKIFGHLVYVDNKDGGRLKQVDIPNGSEKR